MQENQDRYRHIFDDIQFFPLPLDFNSMLEPSYINTTYRGGANRPPQNGIDGADFTTRRSEEVDVIPEETLESFRLALALLQNVAMSAGGAVGPLFDDSPSRVLREPLEALVCDAGRLTNNAKTTL